MASLGLSGLSDISRPSLFSGLGGRLSGMFGWWPSWSLDRWAIAIVLVIGGGIFLWKLIHGGVN